MSKKKQIIDAAIKVYASKSISEVVLSDIARAAKTTPQVLRYHFLTEYDLHLELIRTATNHLRVFSTEYIAKKSKPKNALSMMEFYLDASFEWAKGNPGLFKVWAYMLYQSLSSKEVQQVFCESRAQGRQRIENIIYQGIEENVWARPRDISVPELAVLVQNVITGQVLAAAADPTVSFSKSNELLHKAIGLILSRK